MWKAEFSIGLINGWWFLLLFLILNLILMWVFPKHYKAKILHLPNFDNGKLIGILYALCLNVTLIYSIFVSIKWNTIWGICGIAIFFLGGVCFVNALFHYAHTEPNKPTVTGIYRYSRNPQQIFAVIMWIGVGISTTSYILLILCVLQLVFAYPTFVAQEKFCIEKYGIDYEKYMKEAPRYFWKI